MTPIERWRWLRSLPVEDRVRATYGYSIRAKDDHVEVEVPSMDAPVLGADCYFPGCANKRTRSGQGYSRYCHGHRKQKERGQRMRALKVKP